MKYIQVKKEIQITANGEAWKDNKGKVEPPWSFATYLDNVVLPDPSIGTTYKALKACNIIAKQFNNAQSGRWIGVEDEHWNLMKSAIDNPKGSGIHSGILRQLTPFMDAVVDAKSEKPSDAQAEGK